MQEHSGFSGSNLVLIIFIPTCHALTSSLSIATCKVATETTVSGSPRTVSPRNRKNALANPNAAFLLAAKKDKMPLKARCIALQAYRS